MDDNDLTGLEMLNLKIDEVAFSICLISISEIISNTKDRQEKGMELWFSSITICWMFFGEDNVFIYLTYIVRMEGVICQWMVQQF